jgi:hypothetical protein
VVIHDFTVLNLLTSTDFKENDVTDLIVVIETKHNNQSHRQYVDIICENLKQKNDFYFVRAAWLWLANNLLKDVNVIHLWSDGATKHFKQIYTQHFLGQLAFQFHKLLNSHFFASYHGSSLCDSHAAKANTALRSERQKLYVTNNHRSDLTSAIDIKSFLESRLSNTTGLR